MRIAFDLRPDHVDEQRADAGADQRHADEVGRQQQRRAGDAADDARAITIGVVSPAPKTELAASAPMMKPNTPSTTLKRR